MGETVKKHRSLIALAYPTPRPVKAVNDAFSLVEMAIVIGVMGVIAGGIWSVGSEVRQTSRLNETKNDTGMLVDGVRSAYAAMPNIQGTSDTTIPIILQSQSVPSGIVNGSTSPCNGVTFNYLSTRWGGGADTCGTLHICAWSLGYNANCNIPTVATGAQNFAVEFTWLDYKTCVALAAGISPDNPKGLQDVVINGVSLRGLGWQPVTAKAALTLCVVPAINNVVDAVYSLRAPAF